MAAGAPRGSRVAAPGALYGRPLAKSVSVALLASARGAVGALLAGRPAVDLPRGGPTGIKVAKQWSADLLYSADLVGMNFTDGRGQFFYDQTGERYRLTFVTGVHLFSPNATMLQDQLYKNISGTTGNFTTGEGEDGVCLPNKSPYWDIFGWAASATRTGADVVDGVPCDVFEANGTVPSFLGMAETHFQACFAADGVPRTLFMKYLSGKALGKQMYTFSNVKVGDPGDDAFKNSFACESNFPCKPCEDTGVEIIDLYRVFGPPEPMELGSRDAGDALGDLSFLCTQASGEAYRSKLITHWKVTVSKAFGQYALCNFNGTANVCSGTPEQLRRVGRRSSQMQGGGRLGGQCSSNEDVGSQYSFSTEGKCSIGQVPGRGLADCAWGDAVPIRTVKARCVLEERGLLEACRQEFGHAPFLKSKRIFEAAFETDDPAQGGCPDAAEELSPVVIV